MLQIVFFKKILLGVNKIFYIFKIKIFIVGAAIDVEFDHPESKINIQNNFFLKNQASMAGALSLVQMSGITILMNNIFEKNVAITQDRVLIGAGAAFLLSGSVNTIVKSNQNIYINNENEYKG